MKEGNQDVRHKVLKWLAYGDEDLRLANYGLSMESPCPYRLIAYHAQQCAEKYLKAFLVFHEVDFPYTHDIRRLLALCADQSKWGDRLKDARILTPYAVTARYPGEDKPIAKREAKHAVRLAESVRKMVRTTLQREGLQLNE